MNSIDDPNETAKKLAENTEAEHTGKPRGEGDLLAEVEATNNEVIAALPGVERASFQRELVSSLQRATWAAERLAQLSGDEAPESTEPEAEEGPITEPTRPHRRSLALLSDSRVALSLAYVEGANLAGRERWEGIILSPEEAGQVLNGLSDAADDVAAKVGGLIRWRKDEPEGGEGDDGHG